MNNIKSLDEEIKNIKEELYDQKNFQIKKANRV